MTPGALGPADVHPPAGVHCPPRSRKILQSTHRHFAGDGAGAHPLADRWGAIAPAAILSELVH